MTRSDEPPNRSRQGRVLVAGDDEAMLELVLRRWPWRLLQHRTGSAVPRVLLAEDDEDMRALLTRAFRSEGCEVTECIDGPDLVSKLGTYVLFGPPVGFDLVVSDIRLPGATALEILDAMRGCTGVPPVILVTAFPTEDTRAEARRLGVAAVFDKPFEIEDLISKSRDLLDKLRGDMQ